MPASVSVRTPIPTGEPSHEDVDALLEDAPSLDVVTPIFAEDAVLAHLMVPAAPAEAEPPSTGVVESAELETEVEGIGAHGGRRALAARPRPGSRCSRRRPTRSGESSFARRR